MRGDGPTDGFREIVAAHGPMLRRIAASYEADPALREELGQEILMAIWRALPGFRQEASIRTFVARIAHNEPSPLESLERLDQRDRLTAAVRTLPLSLRQVTIQTLEGFTPAEIADVLGVGANVVSIRLTRAKAALRTILETGDDH